MLNFQSIVKLGFSAIQSLLFQIMDSVKQVMTATSVSQAD